MILEIKMTLLTAPGDFTATSGSLTISEDGSVECVSIAIVNDIEDEGDMECFAFSISTATSGSVSLDVSQATICIIDNDGRVVFSTCFPLCQCFCTSPMVLLLSCQPLMSLLVWRKRCFQ